MINNFFKILSKAVFSASNEFVLFESAIKNAENIENVKYDLMALGLSCNEISEIIEECKNYSYTLSIPNHKGFMKRFLFIQDKLQSGKKWIDIKAVLND